MDVLPVNFRTFQIFGLWYDNLKSFWILKIIHRSIVLLFIFHFALFQFITLLTMRDQGVEAFTACLFLTFTYIAASFKLIHFIFDRENINYLLDRFRSKICQPQTPSELDILTKYVAMSNKVFVMRMVTTGASGLAFFITALVVFNREELQLPVNAYQMFNISTTFSYSVAYVIQLMTTVCCISMDVCLDSTACAFIILTCGQLELLCNRIISVDKKISVKDIVAHHSLIHVIAKRVQSSFITVILPVFCSGLITLCSSIYQLAQKGNTLIDYVSFILYVGCLLFQLYYYCWFGNELQIKSETVSDAVFRSDWLTLGPSERRSYWFIMFISRNELVISYHGQCALTLRTLIWMVKTSYGAFNLLQQVSSSDL